MIDHDAQFHEIGSGRLKTLRSSAYRLRQHAIKTGGDIEGWQLARRMRDADSVPAALAAERDFGAYVRSHALETVVA
ncbi:MAG: hypothetical protein ABWY64_27375 [Tardiphaga sp.]